MDEVQKPDIERVLDYYASQVGKRIRWGRSLAGRVKINCPFHEDDNPSAVADLDNQRFRCFAGCAPNGDSYDVIQEREGIGFNEAKQWARDHVGFTGGEVHTSPADGRYRPAFGPDDDD